MVKSMEDKMCDVLPPLKKWGLLAQEYQRIQYQRANPVRPTVFTNDRTSVPWIFYAQKEAWFSHIRFLCATVYIQLSMCLSSIMTITKKIRYMQEVPHLRSRGLLAEHRLKFIMKNTLKTEREEQ